MLSTSRFLPAAAVCNTLSTDSRSGVVIGDDRDAGQAAVFEGGLGNHCYGLQ